MGFWEFLHEGGQTLEIQAGGGLYLNKSSAKVISTNSSRDSNIKFVDTSALSDSETSRNIVHIFLA